jgi:hypothetical protein
MCERISSGVRVSRRRRRAFAAAIRDFLQTTRQRHPLVRGEVIEQAASRFSRRTGTSTRSIVTGGPAFSKC